MSSAPRLTSPAGPHPWFSSGSPLGASSVTITRSIELGMAEGGCACLYAVAVYTRAPQLGSVRQEQARRGGEPACAVPQNLCATRLQVVDHGTRLQDSRIVIDRNLD